MARNRSERLQGERVPGRHGGSHLPEIRLAQFGHAGGAKPDAAGMGRSQGKDLAQALPGRIRADGVAGDQRILGKGSLDVHGQVDVRVGGKERGQDVRAQAVGINRDRQARGGHGHGEAGQSGDERRFAAGHYQPVEPAFVAVQEAAHGLLGQRRRGLGAPGQGGVVAMGTAQVAAAEKDHGGQTSRPVAQGHGLDAAHEPPSGKIGHFLNNTSVVKEVTIPGPLPNAPRPGRPQHSPSRVSHTPGTTDCKGGLCLGREQIGQGRATPGDLFLGGNQGRGARRIPCPPGSTAGPSGRSARCPGWRPGLAARAGSPARSGR